MNEKFLKFMQSGLPRHFAWKNVWQKAQLKQEQPTRTIFPQRQVFLVSDVVTCMRASFLNKILDA